MARYIDATLLTNLFDEEYKKTEELIRGGETHLDSLAEGYTEAYFVVAGAPTADVQEAKHGKWIEVEIEDGDDIKTYPSLTTMRCDQCKLYHTTVYFYGNPVETMHFCPHCGAKMDEEDNRQ